jgi:Asp-tRNA(Asn)/Glu-tRNA(Gln) amidotransferase A subunit family amidase
VDVSRFKLHEHAGLLWGEDVSPHFEGQLARVERAIAALPDEHDDVGGPWPPAPLPPATAPTLPAPPLAAVGDLTEAGVATLARAFRTREVRSSEVVEALLERSARLDDMLHVWAWLDADRARRHAHDRDRDLDSGVPLEPLPGVPLGIKDIIDVDEVRTGANSRVAPRSGSAPEDAPAVLLLRLAGAVLLGKTATTEYAYADPSACRNPWNPAHTPGGSSSGSAAGVAARLIPGALGTQTAGSVLRPAAFCGVVGLKPTTERISRMGVLPLARSLDHVGTLTRSVADAALLYRVMAQGEEAPYDERTPRLAFWPDLLSDHTDAATRDALRAAATTLERAGASVDLVEGETTFLQAEGFFQQALDVHAVIMAAEVSTYHFQAHADRRTDLGPRLRAIVEAGAVVPAQTLLAAQARRRRLWQRWQDSEARRYDAVIVPAAPGTAPEGLDFTGDPSLNGPWSLLGVPAISIPIAVAANGLPLGMQLVAPYGEDARLLSVAHWCEQAIGFSARPQL